MGGVYVLGINASPRNYGNAYKLLRIALEGAKSVGSEVKLVNLYEYNIKPCIGCVSDDQKACRYPCVIDDDMRILYEEVLKADGMIIATPVYWFNVSGVLKNFIDRLTVFENMIVIEGRCWIEGKVAGVIAVGNDSGVIMTISNLFATLNSMGLIIPPWALAYINSKVDAFDNENAILDSYNLGRNVALLAKILKDYKISWYESKVDNIEKILETIKKEVSKNYEKALKDRIPKISALKNNTSV